MLEIEIEELELYDAEKEEFIVKPKVALHLEHSLVSLSKWESKWEVPFLSTKEKTDAQMLDYIRCMTISPDVSDEHLLRLSLENIEEINRYIHAKMTATWFSDRKNEPPSRETITAELIYYWLISLDIPFECQYWHLGKLLTLIRVCSEKNKPNDKKMSKSDLASRNRALNAQRKAQRNTSG